MDNLTILIADDHPVFRKGLRALLSTMPNVELVGEAASGEEAIMLAEKLQPDQVADRAQAIVKARDAGLK